MGWLMGHTGTSFFDVWSLVHFAFWFFVGSLVWAHDHAAVAASKLSKRPLYVAMCLSVALAWEVFERFAEKKWPALWLNPESWYNSWLSDPLMCVLGVLAALYALDHWRKT